MGQNEYEGNGGGVIEAEKAEHGVEIIQDHRAHQT